jgi:cell division protein FtsA
LAGDSDEESSLYATAVGLVMNSIDNKTQSAVRKEEVAPPRPISYREPVIDYSDSVRQNIKKKKLKNQ